MKSSKIERWMLWIDKLVELENTWVDVPGGKLAARRAYLAGNYLPYLAGCWRWAGSRRRCAGRTWREAGGELVSGGGAADVPGGKLAASWYPAAVRRTYLAGSWRRAGIRRRCGGGSGPWWWRIVYRRRDTDHSDPPSPLRRWSSRTQRAVGENWLLELRLNL